MKENQQDKKEQIKELLNQLEDGVKSLRTSEEWKNFLKMEAKLPHYSFRNCMLILMQKPDATIVQSYTAWKELGRYVEKGERGIRIIAPCPYKKQVLVDATDGNGNVIYNEEGQPLKEYETRVMEGYKVVHIFDVSQTAGKELPEICTRLEGTVEGLQEMKEAIIEVSPVPITFEKVKGEANGYYSPAEKKIVVDSDLSELQQVKTLLHEVSHCWLDINGKDKDAERPTKEIEAESISFVVMNNLLGDKVTPEDIGKYSFGYISSWSGTDDDLKEMKKVLHTVQQTALEIIRAVDACMTEKMEAKEAEQTEQKKEVEKTSAQVKAHPEKVADEVRRPSHKQTLHIHM